MCEAERNGACEQSCAGCGDVGGSPRELPKEFGSETAPPGVSLFGVFLLFSKSPSAKYKK